MSGRWIDIPDYVGLTRRSGLRKFRVPNRRRKDLAGNPPSLPTLLRRLRLECAGLDTPEGQASFLAHLETVTIVALEHGAEPCAQALQEMARLMRGETATAPNLDDLDTLLLQAIALAD